MRLLSLVCLLLISFQGVSQTLLVLGDSLSAGYQMPIAKAWPTLLENALLKQGNNIKIVNGSISGDTTATAINRLPQLLSSNQPDYVLIELGANDGLQGLPLNIPKQNLLSIIQQVRKSNAKPILMKIRIPPNYGKRYSDAFSQIYPQVAEQLGVPLIPFFMESVVVKKEWMKKDGLHPNELAQPWIANFMATQLKPHLSQ